MSVSVDLPLQNTPAARTKAPGGYWAGVWRRLRRDPMTVAFALVLLAIAGMAIAAPLIAPADPYKTSMLRRLLPPGAPQHLLGTDELGRDMLTRLIYGGRLSLFMGLVPVINALVIGGSLGHSRRLCRRRGQYRNHAHPGSVLRLPIGLAGDRAVRRARGGHRQYNFVADDRFYRAYRPRRRGRDDARFAASITSRQPAPRALGPLA